MLEWLKTILGEGYTPDIDKAVSGEIAKAYVARSDHEAQSAKLKEAETQVKQLDDTVKARDKQLEDLKKSAGDNEDLQKQIDALTKQNKDQKAAYDKELATVKQTAAVDTELTAAGSKSNIAVRALLAEFLQNATVQDGKVVSKENGQSVTLGAKLEAMKKDAASDFLFSAATRKGWKPGEGGDNGKAGGKKPSEMSYSELADYLAQNPDAKLE